MVIEIIQKFTSIYLCLANFQDLNTVYFVTRMLSGNEAPIQKMPVEESYNKI